MDEEQEEVSGIVKTSGGKARPKITLLPLIALIFYSVCGGPFGVEDSFPENGGYVLWISTAFGPFLGFQVGFWRWFSGVMDNALYPVLFLDYLKHSLPVFNRLIARIPALLGITFSLTYLNYRGLHIVGFSAVAIAIFSLCPFFIMGLLSIPRIKPKQWLVVDVKMVNWRGYFNNMFWNLNYWDGTLPKALFGAVILVICTYLIPLLAGTGALESKASEWSDGYFAEVGMLIGGVWLKWWIQAAAAVSNMALFEAEMSGDAFQLLGMSEMGMLPAFFASRSKYGTPTISILCSATGVLFLSWLSFQEIIEFLNFLYSIGMLIEFAAFVRLRIDKPDLRRPFRVPLQTLGVTILCVPPGILLILVMCLASFKTLIVSGSVIVLGMILHVALVQAKGRNWIKFEPIPMKFSDSSLESIQMVSQDCNEVTDEASTGLLSSD
ncbi:hypothetical protein MKW92_053864 [Papaver armeniacum]|nr:hypothetical protein MKW92_053864 [Papaver armeniacum]